MHDAELAPLKIVIAYNSSSDGVRALALTERLGRELKCQCKLSTEAWEFLALRSWPVRLQATSIALTADIIIIATSDEVLPKEMKTCVESWIIDHRIKKSLVVFLASPESNNTLVRAYLQRLAEKAGMDFMSNTREASSAVEKEMLTRAQRRALPPSNVFAAPPSHSKGL